MNKFLVFVCLSVISCSTGIIDDDAPTDCPVQNGFVASPGYTYQLLSENIFQHSNLDIQYWDEEIGYFLEKSSPFRFMKTVNGGRNWTELNRFDSASGFKFRTSEEGVVITSILNPNINGDRILNTIYKTTNGGLTWEANMFISKGRYLSPTYTFIGNSFLVLVEYSQDNQLILKEEFNSFSEIITLDTLASIMDLFGELYTTEEDAVINTELGVLEMVNPQKTEIHFIDENTGELGDVPINPGFKIVNYISTPNSIIIEDSTGNYFYTDQDQEFIAMELGQAATIIGILGSESGVFISINDECGLNNIFRTSNYLSVGLIKEFGVENSTNMNDLYVKSFADRFGNIIIVGRNSLHKLVN